MTEAQLNGEFNYWKLLLRGHQMGAPMTLHSRERVVFEIHDLAATACEVLHGRGQLDARMAAALDELRQELDCGGGFHRSLHGRDG